MIVIVFSVSMFLSAALLFLVEPMLAKMMLPMLGGTPAVWNTCLVFLSGSVCWRAILCVRRDEVAGTSHADRGASLPCSSSAGDCWLTPLHLHAGWVPPAESDPAVWILMMLLIAVGLPFFALTSSTPICSVVFGVRPSASRGPILSIRCKQRG